MTDTEKNTHGNPAAHAPGQPVVAVIGDGQLARMMQTAAIELGQSVRLLAGAPEASAAQVAADVLLGDYRDLDALRAAAEGASAVTFDHEHVPSEHLRALIDAGVSVQPRPEALLYAQDKLEQRRRLRELGFPVPRFSAVTSVAEALAFEQEVAGQVCLKACRGGYDGHGVWFPADRAELEELVADLLDKGVGLMAEEKVRFDRELSAMVARTPSGEVTAWPVVESEQKDGICHRAIAPAPGMSAEDDSALRTLAEEIAQRLGVTGVLAVELFDQGGQYWINELAMRPHNTGHWTQDGSTTSQFEQHLRAVLDMPLGDTSPIAPVTVMVNTLGAPEEPAEPVPSRMRQVWRRFPGAKIHLYGKDHRPGRKLGHINLVGSDVSATVREADLAAHYLVHGRWADGWAPVEDAAAQPK
ncbi:MULTISPECIES: 5-(carboxyamino)imidazole ribonucleotide synthase [unclassified Corynebacterium]|uniref:5-(carboxyamino)imidazole ribonucleotide synthase n=1 Tax=unclassified Corynebacterium TaxID=2624378 RepID=UPI0029CA1E11|nr:MULTISPECIES: 5-(carboxyamino)imidazole ribonucleotide synthase [unclassified Corynebacterium]WPF66624.1 5-(carboxyamino)imidazole ribonucleotide synthase [Corynebacterium sp. 22KM0430]WPF69112.1 5-(carboxyamino)imidazole ribonucleotide synthase [Corynebacterium sp. 21KM1197]